MNERDCDELNAEDQPYLLSRDESGEPVEGGSDSFTAHRDGESSKGVATSVTESESKPDLDVSGGLQKGETADAKDVGFSGELRATREDVVSHSSEEIAVYAEDDLASSFEQNTAGLASASGETTRLPSSSSGNMSERDRSQRRGSKNAKVDRLCSNAANSSSSGSSQSRNHLHRNRRHESSEARNRPRSGEKTHNSSRSQNASNFEKEAEEEEDDRDLGTMMAAATGGGSDAGDDLVGAIGGEQESRSSLRSQMAERMALLAGQSVNVDVLLSSSSPATHNWQATKSTVRERLGFMYCSELLADVHFVVGKTGQTQRIPAHRFVLSIGSAVFDAMFNGRMATVADEVELPDVEPAAFRCLLQFLYADDVQIGPDTVMASLYAAKKYAVPALERACVDYLKKNLTSDNAFMLLTQARLFDETQLAAICLETIDKTTSEALAADGFTDVDLDTLCTVLERDTLGIKECKLFAAVVRWAEAECRRRELPVAPENQRGVMGRALDLIRFPLMSVEEFAVGAAQSGLLADREVVELFLYFTVTPRPAIHFSDVLRCCLTGKEQVVSRFCEIQNRWGYGGTSDRIRFMVNRKIFIVGFGLYGSIHSSAEHFVNIQIIHTDTGHVCGLNDTTFLSDGSMSTFRVMFKEPVEIQPNTSYTASATLKGPDTFYGCRGLRKVTHESVASGKVIFQFTYAAGSNNGTSVEDGQLPEIVFYTTDPIG